MNNLVSRINHACVENTYRLHDLLDQTLIVLNDVIPGIEIKFNPDNGAFVTKIDDLIAVIVRDMNTYTLSVKILGEGDVVYAECEVNVGGGFNEKYARMSPATKLKVVNWFNGIGDIDCKNLLTEEPGEMEPATVEGPIEAEDVLEDEVEAIAETEPETEKE